ncbi:hypothetical protein CC85DRAFT_147889 [Cutaneotrichosporon oleaginosum]|uniref:Uncharacterized protein n=1 Tax=Cutaneotrichosporon oleaginosum TaxID=879819 RepID=A0A0J0XHE3_9TREE|nr:uncharacterized protein CC85DRAFT_147889 [Cutaneotrichosporon oleaginosum]KLT40511.1 hypothetical protein CC85DRAFT_147889 [Cutaneotrichosporon oleaginosum]TXT08417.1 hypothetical protein COLE_05341 [Cutaneotrichosporon oleaginosum]
MDVDEWASRGASTFHGLLRKLFTDRIRSGWAVQGVWMAFVSRRGVGRHELDWDSYPLGRERPRTLRRITRVQAHCAQAGSACRTASKCQGASTGPPRRTRAPGRLRPDETHLPTFIATPRNALRPASALSVFRNLRLHVHAAPDISTCTCPRNRAVHRI